MSATSSEYMAQGLYAELTFNGQFSKFLNGFSSGLGAAVEPEEVHASILYPEELIRAGLSRDEEAKLPGVEKLIRDGLANEEITGQPVEVVPNILRPYKKFLGIEIINCDVINTIRSTCTNAILDILGIDLGGCLDDPHISVARRPKSDGCRKLIKYEKSFPQDLTIAGLNIGIRNVAIAAAKKQKYANGSTTHCTPGQHYS